MKPISPRFKKKNFFSCQCNESLATRLLLYFPIKYIARNSSNAISCICQVKNFLSVSFINFSCYQLLSQRLILRHRFSLSNQIHSYYTSSSLSQQSQHMATDHSNSAGKLCFEHKLDKIRLVESIQRCTMILEKILLVENTVRLLKMF